MLSDKEIANLESFYCNKHKIYKVKDNTTGTFNCLGCLHENSNISNVRHEIYSNLSRNKIIYFTLVFSLFYSLVTFLSELFSFIISFTNIIVSSNSIFIIKVLISVFLTIIFDKNIKVRK